MKFEEQIEKVREKGRKTCNLLNFTCGIYRGMEVNTAILLYKNYVRSVIEYGNFIFMPSQYSKILKIERLQYAGVRRALGYRCSTPTNISESKISNLMQRAIYLAKNFTCVKLAPHFSNF